MNTKNTVKKCTLAEQERPETADTLERARNKQLDA